MEAKIKLPNPIKWQWHRSGMPPVTASLRPLCRPDGLLCVDAEEKLYQNTYTEPFILISHFCPETPKATPFTLENVLASEQWKKHEHLCRGIVCLSEYCARYLRSRLSIPIDALCLPSLTSDKPFDFDAFNRERKVVQLGHWLRVPGKFDRLRCTYRKIALVGDPEVREKHYLPDFGTKMEIPEWIDHREFDELVRASIVFLHLKDASANNAVVDCIVRKVPLLINRLPAVVEYLGAEYPFFYADEEDANAKVMNDALILRAHQYLKQNYVQENVNLDTFARKFSETRVYQSI